MRTEIIEVEINHPNDIKITKKVIIYYDNADVEITKEIYIEPENPNK